MSSQQNIQHTIRLRNIWKKKKVSELGKKWTIFDFNKAKNFQTFWMKLSRNDEDEDDGIKMFCELMYGKEWITFDEATD